ncbi:ornithine cyclodeaminase family protein [Streptomyces sp. NPDC007991]|uniref:ornithine cyclodeaminase family protein n=1 Tax=Streptomyces sp. NPDC007991 TaxID=3364803 RepID=UPI0036EAB31C
MLCLDHDLVVRLLPMERAIATLRRTMRHHAQGRVTQPLRTVLRPPGAGAAMAAMPCHSAGPEQGGFAVKTVLHVPGNIERGRPAVTGVLLLFAPDTGECVALLDAASVTAIRTAAVSAVATDALAGPDAGDLALLGAGTQARSHLKAMAAVRELRSVRVWSRSRESAEAFRRWAREETGVEVEVADRVAAALDGADLVCTVTSAREPFVEPGQLAPGAHVNAVGSSFPDHREIGGAVVRAASVFVDSRESAWAEAGDLRIARDEGLIGEEHIAAELGEVLTGAHPGRRGLDECTLFKSVGLAVQDLAAGFAAVESARAAGQGTEVVMS